MTRGIFYGWVVVGSGIVVTCIGMGAMLSLSVFLQPMAEAMGWSRTGISTTALVSWLCMGVGAFVWGALSDRFGTRASCSCGGVLLGLGLVMASRADHARSVPAPVRRARRRCGGQLLRSADRDDHALVHAAIEVSPSRWCPPG